MTRFTIGLIAGQIVGSMAAVLVIELLRAAFLVR
jgi:gas vesicle protein